MFRRLRDLMRLAWIMVMMAGLGGTSIRAGEPITVFRNDTKSSVVVQLANMVHGNIRRGHPHVLYPGASMRESLPGDKLVHIYDARMPNRILYRGAIPASPASFYFAIRPRTTPTTVSVEQITSPGSNQPRKPQSLSQSLFSSFRSR